MRPSNITYRQEKSGMSSSRLDHKYYLATASNYLYHGRNTLKAKETIIDIGIKKSHDN